MDSNFQFPDIVEGSFFGRSEQGSVAEPKVCKLAAGGKWIRTFGPSQGFSLARKPTSGVRTAVSLRRDRRFEAVPAVSQVRT